MSNLISILERQAKWQKGRRQLSWPEKIRRAEAIRKSILQLRATAPNQNQTKPHPVKSTMPANGKSVRE